MKSHNNLKNLFQTRAYPLNIIIHFLFFLILIGPTNALSSVWKDDKKWDKSWEQKYSNWVAGPEVTLDMFTDPQKKYYGITADCADAVYALRAIFSYENGLPFSFVNPHFKKKTLFSNRTSQFNRIKKGSKRFKVLLKLYWNHTKHLSPREK